MRRGPRTRRLAAALATLSAAVLVLSACSILPGAAHRSTSKPTGEKVAAALQPYYSQVLTWSPCTGGAQCATAKAPLDWDHPGTGGDVKLALARRTATSGHSKGSMFFNPGGPGGSGVDFVLGSPSILDDSLRADYDFVSWDPRGVGRSSAVTCFANPKDFDDFLYGVPPGAVGSPEWLAQYARAGKAFADACTQHSGDLLAHLDTLSTVHDLDMLRAIVGDAKLTYFGMSYGTKIGEQYAEHFTDHVGRMTLDGVVDPSESTFQTVLSQTKGFDTALRNYLAACSSQGCPFHGDADAAIQRIKQLYDRLDAKPIKHSDGRLMNSDVVDVAVSEALYDQAQWPTLSQMFTQVFKGGTELAFRLADEYFERSSDGTYPDHFYEAFLAINCVDYPTETDLDTIRAQNAQLAAITPLVVDEVAAPDPVCSNWPYPAVGEVGPVSAPGAPPILLVGTTGDPATPYASAQAVHAQLQNSVLLTYNGDDHIAYDEGDPCVTKTVDDYFLRGTVPTGDPRCNF